MFTKYQKVGLRTKHNWSINHLIYGQPSGCCLMPGATTVECPCCHVCLVVGMWFGGLDSKILDVDFFSLMQVYYCVQVHSVSCNGETLW